MILIVDMTSNLLSKEEFVNPIARIAKKDYEIKHYSEIKSIGKYSKILLSGTALKDNIFAKNKFRWIKNCNKPVLGICAGMEAIGIAFGCRLTKTKEIGMIQINALRDNKLFEGKFEAYALHNYSVKWSKDFEILAESTKCAQAVKLREKEIYGLMFHPEARNNEIIERFLSA